MTITWKLILAYGIVFALALGVFSAVIYHNARTTTLERIDTRLKAFAGDLGDEVEELEAKNGFPARQLMEFARLSQHRNLRFRILDRQGIVCAGDTVLQTVSKDGWHEAIDGAAQSGFITVEGRTWRSHWAPLDVNDRVAYAVQVAVRPLEMEAELRRLRLLFLIGLPALLFLTGVAAFFITRRSFRPVRSMAETARLVTAGSLNLRLPVPGPRDEIRELAETLNAMMGRIDQAFRSQTRFVSDAAHEIRTPLTVIAGELEMAETANAEDARLGLLIAKGELQRLSRLVDGLLALARLDAVESGLALEPVRLDELLVEAIRRMSAAAGAAEISLRPHIEDAVEIRGDREGLRSVLLNLLDNAIKYSPPGSAVDLELGPGRSGEARIVVRDQGRGIADADLPHVFRRFYRSESVRSEVGGSGLGLAIAERVVKLHGGRIDLQSAVGHGSVFTVDLPLI